MSYPAVAYVPPWLPGHLPSGQFQRPDKDWKTGKTSPAPIMIAVPAELDRAEEMTAFIEKTYRGLGWSVSAKPMAWEKLLKGYMELSI